MRFVYVEDEREVQRQAAMWLRYERHEVTVFDNAIDALNHVRADEPEVLLCDYKLEGSPNGLILAAQVRQLYPACTIEYRRRGHQVSTRWGIRPAPFYALAGRTIVRYNVAHEEPTN